MTDNCRPTWTQSENSFVLWKEDDATTGGPDHETLPMAWRRLYPDMPNMPTTMAVWDGGDADYRLLEFGYVVISSYPGNSEIRVIQHMATVRDLEIARGKKPLALCPYEGTCSVCQKHFARHWAMVIHGQAICHTCVNLLFLSMTALTP